MFTIFERGISTVAFYDAITEFIFIEDRPQKSDIIFIPGSDYGCLAAHAAALYREGLPFDSFAITNIIDSEPRLVNHNFPVLPAHFALRAFLVVLTDNHVHFL